MKSKIANVHFNPSGTPVADDYDDVYFSNDSGINETEHVFMAGNDLPQRWTDCQHHSFVIAETGFGTGLNFLVALRAFRAFRAANPHHPLKHLYFVSTEKFPLHRDAMLQALSRFEVLQREASELVHQYPVAMQGCHRVEFANAGVTLDLWIGDVHDVLPLWSTPESGLVDAWFLDGFAPSKNPDMWTQALFDQMARVTRVGGSFATFTAAGVVKRGMAEAGFTVTKRPGFGRKRDMLAGSLCKAADASRQSQPPYFRYTAPLLNAGDHVVIAGAGLAGAISALMLCEKGIRVTLCDSRTPAAGASGNPQGGFYPQLHGEASHASQIQAHSFLFAQRFYQRIAHAHPFAHDFCGVLQLSINADSQARHQKVATADIWPDALVRLTDKHQTSALAGLHLPYPALSIPLGGWLSPPELIAAALTIARDTGLLTEQYGQALTEAKETDSQALAYFDNGGELHADHLIVATGHEALSLGIFAPLPMRSVRGQVEAIPTDATLSKLNQVLCHKGYLTPALNGRHALGSTYIKQDVSTTVRADESEANLALHRNALSQCDWAEGIIHDGQARAAVRLGAPDHQPMCGALGELDKQYECYAELQKGKPLSAMPLPPATRLSALTALGSRGLTTAPLMAQTLISGLLGLPMPASTTLLNAVSPNRFVIRDCIRGRRPDVTGPGR